MYEWNPVVFIQKNKLRFTVRTGKLICMLVLKKTDFRKYLFAIIDFCFFGCILLNMILFGFLV